MSFEPVREVYERLQENAKSDPRWICYNLALGERHQEKTINVYESSVFSSFLEATDYSKNIWSSLDTMNEEVVQVSRLDDIFPELVAKTTCGSFFLKMDTQGYDINVFRGAIGSLRNVKALQSELSLIAVYKKMRGTYRVLDEYHVHDFSSVECIL